MFDHHEISMTDLDSPVSFGGVGGGNSNADHGGFRNDLVNIGAGVAASARYGTAPGAAFSLGLAAIDRGYGIGGVANGPGEARPGFDNHSYNRGPDHASRPR